MTVWDGAGRDAIPREKGEDLWLTEWDGAGRGDWTTEDGASRRWRGDERPEMEPVNGGVEGGDREIERGRFLRGKVEMELDRDGAAWDGARQRRSWGRILRGRFFGGKWFWGNWFGSFDFQHTQVLGFSNFFFFFNKSKCWRGTMPRQHRWTLDGKLSAV
jgi:hypothetical protein